MGGWFSSNEPKQPTRTPSYRPSTFVASDDSYYPYQRTTSYRASYSTQPIPKFANNTQRVTRSTNVSDNYYVDEVLGRLGHLGMGSGQFVRQIQGPQKSARNIHLLNLIDVVGYLPNIVTYIPLESYEFEYLTIMKMITNKKNFKVDSIEKIKNPFLEKAYELKKVQKEKEFRTIEERLLFHGTKRTHVTAICEKNFNWRLCQTHKYGKGISFSPNSTYASVYSDENVHNKVMLVVKVMIGQSCIGNAGMILPPSGFDTSQKGRDGVVIVKYEDHEFYPVYKINYHVRDENVGKRSGYKKRGGTSSNNNRSPNSYSDSDFDKIFAGALNSDYVFNRDYYD